MISTSLDDWFNYYEEAVEPKELTQQELQEIRQDAEDYQAAIAKYVSDDREHPAYVHRRALLPHVSFLEQRIREGERALAELLVEAHAAIAEAITSEDGLDGAVGEEVNERIVAALPVPLPMVEHVLHPEIDCPLEGVHNHVECGCPRAVLAFKRGHYLTDSVSPPTTTAKDLTPSDVDRICLTCGADLEREAKRNGVSLDPCAVFCGPQCDPRECAAPQRLRDIAAYAAWCASHITNKATASDSFRQIALMAEGKSEMPATVRQAIGIRRPPTTTEAVNG